MSRSISLNRRRLNWVELCWPSRSDVAQYIIKTSTTFGGAYTTVLTIPSIGYISPNLTAVQSARMESSFRGVTRVILDPAALSLDDTKDIWIRVAPISTAGVTGPDEARHLIPPYSAQPNRVLNIRGSVAAAASLANSIELNLPGQFTNPTIQNSGANDLYVAFEIGGGEFRVPPLSSGFTNLTSFKASFSQVFLRADTTATTMDASFVSQCGF
jgi:hypothetical protein